MKRIYALTIGFVFVFGLFMFGATVGHASILGEIWQDDFSNTAATIPASTLPYAQFYTNDIDYNSSTTGYTVSQFLNSPTFFNMANGFDSTESLNNVHIRFTGATYLDAGDNSFVVPHDDGLILSVDGIGTVLYAPGPTSPVSTPFNVVAPTAGMYNFTLDYNECCGAPAVLAFEVNGAPVSTPEPGTILLVGLGLIGLAGVRKRIAK